MKSLIVTLFCLLFVSCNQKEKPISDPISGSLIGNSNCKSNLKTDTISSFSCVEYSYQETSKTLTFKHINAGFNCCPEGFYCTISLKNDTIVIEEHENSSLCDCNCLYDLDIELKGVEAKNYQIKFAEPYSGNQDKIEFPVNLVVLKEGIFCVTRTVYPWGI